MRMKTYNKLAQARIIFKNDIVNCYFINYFFKNVLGQYLGQIMKKPKLNKGRLYH